MNETSRLTIGPAGFAIALLAFLTLCAATMPAQSNGAASNTAEASLALPDEPGVLRFSSSAAAFAQTAKTPPSRSKAARPEASRTEGFIEPGQSAPSLTSGDKVVIGVKEAFSPLAAAGWFASAGWEHLTNSSPNYGTDRGAFGQRLGASVIRDSSESILSDSVMAPLLHEDPRYYRMGPGHNFFVRVVYSGTRAILTRTDSGKTSLNFSLLAGTLAGSALTNTYYPKVNHGAGQTMETFGGGIGGSAIGYVVGEFFSDFTSLFHKH